MRAARRPGTFGQVLKVRNAENAVFALKVRSEEEPEAAPVAAAHAAVADEAAADAPHGA